MKRKGRDKHPGPAFAPFTAEDALDRLAGGAGLLFLPSSRVLEATVRERSSGRWEVWYGGSGATYARREDGAILRSLRRLGEAMQVKTAAEHEQCAAVWTGYLQGFGLDWSAGLVALVAKLAPQLRHWRQDTGAGELWRSRLCLAGRAEVLRWQTSSPVAVYDLSSAYPWAYSVSLPGELRSASAREIPGHDCCAAEVDLEVRETDLPPLPCEGELGWAWPVGRWRAWLAGPELHLAERLGCIRKLRRCWVWQQASPLADFAEALYRIRKEAPDATTAAVVKLLLNSTFGLLASQCEGRVVHVRPSRIPEGGVPIGPELWQTTPRTRPGVYHPLAAAVLTSRVRERLYQSAAGCAEPLYLGVDGLHTPLGDPGAPRLGSGLGEWRAEGPWLDGATYTSPGRYLLRGAEDRVRHCGLPAPHHVRELIDHGETTVAVEGCALTGRPGAQQVVRWEPGDGRWIGARRFEASGATRPPSVEEWHAETGGRVPPPLPDFSDIGDSYLAAAE